MRELPDNTVIRLEHTGGVEKVAMAYPSGRVARFFTRALLGGLVLVVAYPWLGALLAVFAGGAGGMEVFELIFTMLVSVLLLSAAKRAFGRRIPGSVTIAGYGESNARVAAFLRRLDDSVGAPELRQVIRSNRGDKQVSEFLLGVAR